MATSRHTESLTTGYRQPESQQQSDEQYAPIFYCRALYDYQSQDPSSLSFLRGHVIEVLTQLESGWWDGLLNDERGWFPSNYVERISDGEAEAYFMQSTHESSNLQSDSQSGTVFDDSSTLDRGQGWPQAVSKQQQRGPGENRNTIPSSGPTSNDFWVPQVTPSGQVSCLSHTAYCSNFL